MFGLFLRGSEQILRIIQRLEDLAFADFAKVWWMQNPSLHSRASHRIHEGSSGSKAGVTITMGQAGSAL